MTPELTMIAALVGVVFLHVVGTGLLLWRCVARAAPGEALVITRLGAAERVVSFTQAVVFPVIARAETIDLSPRRVVIERQGKDGLSCRDGVRADVTAVFVVGVERTVESVLRVAESLGSARANDGGAVSELFRGRFADALATVVRQFDFAELTSRREELRDEVLQVIGVELAGFRIESLTFEQLQQTPIELLDPSHVLDAAGIEKITQVTEEARRRAALERRRVETELQGLEAEARLLLVEIERREAEALAQLSRDTGRTVSREELQRRLDERVEEIARARFRVADLSSPYRGAS